MEQDEFMAQVADDRGRQLTEDEQEMARDCQRDGLDVATTVRELRFSVGALHDHL